MQTTRLGRRWLTTKVIFMVVLFGFGVWGFLDATVWYKSRGLKDSSHKLKLYLEAARTAGRLSPGGVRVEDPAATLTDLRARRKEFASSGQTIELARLEWLDSLANAWELSTEPQPLGRSKPAPAGTTPTANQPAPDQPRHLFFDPVKGEGFSTSGKPSDPRVTVELGGLLDELTRKWNAEPKAKPLSSYDMAVQWIFVAVGIGGGIYLLIAVLRAAATKYRWDPAAKRLELPGGRAIVPADLKDVDKRKWHKFYVTLNLNDGANIELDLYKHDPLEAWVLEMERTAFPDRAQAEADKAKSSTDGGETAAMVAGSSSTNTGHTRSNSRGHDADDRADSGADSGNSDGGGSDGGGGGGDGGGD